MTEHTSPSTEPVPESATAPQRSSRRRRVVGAVGAVVVAAAIGGGFWAWGAASEGRYDEASAALHSQLTDETAAVRAYDARLADARPLVIRIRTVVARPEFVADPGAEASALRQDLTVLEPLATAPTATAPALDAVRPDSGPPDSGPAEGGYNPPWQLTHDSEQLEGRLRQSQQTTSRLVATTGDTKAAEDAVSGAEAAYFDVTAQGAEQLIAASALSNRSVQVALLDLVDQARNPSMSLSRDGTFLGSIFEAETQVRSSEATNQAQQDDPDWAVRREVESFARSLSNGVALEFVWAQEVNGLGSDWLSGTAETYDSHGTYAIINLNYTIESAWTDGLNETDAHALVAHEVGHTQTYRCATLFADPAFAGNQETWATAWSISQGYDVPGSGIEAYGRPTDAQIALAAQCR